MKKIFAIALALVMVLSMASAFASACMGGFDWTATSANNCGKAKVEVVPYVKANNGCGGYNWQVSDCAAAVNGEHVYFALKLTVDADLDAEWWAKADMKITTSGLTTPVWNGGVPENGLTATTATSDKEAVWYFDFTTDTWFKVGTDAGNISVADDVESTPNTKFIKQGVVGDASKAKVCVKLTSTGNNFSEGVVGKYYVSYGTFGTYKALKVYDKKGGTVIAEYTVNADDVVTKVDYTNAGSCAPYDVASIKGFFGIVEGTKLTQKLINKNFGWDDKQEDCFKWNTKATAVVDAECVVAIPKTGDVSVVAYAVMAVVAAAGAMLKK